MSNPNGKAGYELSDAQLKPLILFAVGLAVLVALALWVVARLDSEFERSYERDNAAHPLEAERQPPNAPLLQAKPLLELAQQQRRDRELLEKYSWIDPDNGVVRIPIGRAMALIEERGLPARPAGEEQR